MGSGKREALWARIFDGQVWELVAGEHFECSGEQMRSAIRSAARYRGLAVRVAVRGDAVYVQAREGATDRDG